MYRDRIKVWKENRFSWKIYERKNKNIKFNKGDKVFFSSDPIPGNEKEVYFLIEQLMLKDINVVYPDIKDQLHASGHGNQEDLKFLIRLVNPKFLIPIGGTVRHQRQYSLLAEDLGYKNENIFLLKEGETVFFSQEKMKKGEKVE